jgi:hypothetical protein
MNLKKLIAEEFTRAREYYDNNLRSNNEDALAYYHEEKPGIIDKDVSEFFQDIISSDVANGVEHTLADIMPAFASESPVSFLPAGPGDEDSAMQETTAVNTIFMQQNDGFIQLTSAIKDALLRRFGVFEIQTYEKVSVSYQRLSNVDINIVAAAMQPQSPEEQLDIVSVDGELFEEGSELIDSFFEEVIIRKTTQNKQLLIDTFPPDELLFNEDHEDINLDSARFVARERPLTVSDLLELGYDREIIEELPEYSSSVDYLKPHKQHEVTGGNTETIADNRNKLIRVAFCYYQVDEDNDGIAERRKIVIAGDLNTSPTILEDTPCSTQPYVVGVPFIEPHRVPGRSLFDKLKQVQDIKSKLIRQLLTAGERAVRGRLGVINSQVNMDDIRTSIFGGIVRLTSPQGVVNLPQDPFPAEVANLLGIMDQKRKESGGSAIDKASEEILIGGDTAHGLERIMSAMEQLNSLVAKTLAETFLRQIYVKIHANLRKHFPQDINVKVGDNWKVATPTKWPLRQYVSCSIGLTMGDRLRQAQHYNMLIQEQQALLKEGAITVNEQSLYRLQIARANALMIPHANSFYIDPNSEEGQQAQQQRAQAMQQQKEQEMQVQMMNMQLLPTIEKIKAESAAQVQEMKNQLAQFEAGLKQAVEYEDLSVKYEELRLKLIELNAKYDQEEVPNAA